MELQQLITFVRTHLAMSIVDQSGISQAATSLDLSQMTISQAGTASPDSPGTTRPDLPIEIINLIIRFLDDDLDKQCLARCMRVSKALSAHVAPVLYRSITLTSQTRYLFDFGRGATPIRPGATGAQLNHPYLKHLKELVVNDHEGKDCPYTAERWTNLRVNVDGLRIIPGEQNPTLDPPPLGILPNPTSLASPSAVQHDEPISRCLCTLAINPRKIIMERTSLHHPLPAPLINKCARIDNIVSKICTISDGAERRTRSSPSQRIFYIIMSDMSRRCRDEDAMLLLREMMMAAIPRNSASNIMLVNVEALGIPPPSPEALTVEYSSLTNYFVGETDRMRESCLQRARADPAIWNVRYKSPDELKLVSLQCITIDQYLCDYDTAGVFSDAEIAGFGATPPPPSV
jgi:hypothetical protein